MKLRQLLIYCLCLVVGAMFADAAAAERRVALIVGNSAYKNASTLSNTINDATAIGALFKSIGFEVVISRNDLGVVEFKRTVREFLITAENADMAVVYYAGHGIEISGTNYLIPVDARLSRDYDVDDEAISLDRIIWALQPVRRLRLILLDACRDNPFAAKLRSAGRTPARAGSRSLMKSGPIRWSPTPQRPARFPMTATALTVPMQSHYSDTLPSPTSTSGSRLAVFAMQLSP